MKKIDLLIPTVALCYPLLLLWSFVLGNIGKPMIGSQEIVGAVFFTLGCLAFLQWLGVQNVQEHYVSLERKDYLIRLGVPGFCGIVMTCLTVAWVLSMFVRGPISHTWAYMLGSSLFVPMYIIIWFRREDLRSYMLIFGLVAIPFGCATEYFFYGKDWWHAKRIVSLFGGRLGPEDVGYSFYHGALLPVTGLFVSRTRVSLQEHLCDKGRLLMRALLMSVISGVLMALVLKLSKIPSFYAVAIVFTVIGCAVVILRNDLLRLGLAGIIGTLCWSMPVYFITNTLSPGWVSASWINGTDRMCISGIPVLDILWYMSIGFSGSVLVPFLTGARIVPRL